MHVIFTSVAVGANKAHVRTLFETGMVHVASTITMLHRKVLPRQDMQYSYNER